MGQGMNRKDAIRDVRLARGNLDVAKEEVRTAGWESYAETVRRDLHFALRQWMKNRGFALSAVAILALGVGVSLTIFGFVDAALLQPLPYASPERLMPVNESKREIAPLAAFVSGLSGLATAEQKFPLARWLRWHRLFAADSIRGDTGAGRTRERRIFPNAGCASHSRARLFSRRG
jgi:hypothetical protein